MSLDKDIKSTSQQKIEDKSTLEPKVYFTGESGINKINFRDISGMVHPNLQYDIVFFKRGVPFSGYSVIEGKEIQDSIEQFFNNPINSVERDCCIVAPLGKYNQVMKKAELKWQH